MKARGNGRWGIESSSVETYGIEAPREGGVRDPQDGVECNSLSQQHQRRLVRILSANGSDRDSSTTRSTSFAVLSEC